MNGEYITIADACRMLDISRPTFDSYRRKHLLKDFTIKGRVYFRIVDIIEKLYVGKPLSEPDLRFTAADSFCVEDVEVVPDVFDIRRVCVVDPFGAICLLCCLMGRIMAGRHIYLLVNRGTASFELKKMNFFHELTRVRSEFVHYDEAVFDGVYCDQAEIIIPLHVIGYRGAEKGILDDIYGKLRKQGFSEELCASLGWTLGELADNTATHAGGVPCYFMLSSSTDLGPCKFLALTIGDIGDGIPATLRSSSEYRDLSRSKAFVSAFKSDVSSWGSAHKRGRGLNDLLSIAKGNGAWVRAESNGQGLFFDFRNSSESISARKTGTREHGSRFSMVLIDSEFEYVSRKAVDSVLNDYLEQL